MKLNFIVFVLVSWGLLNVSVLLADDQLRVIYSESDEDETIVESQQNYIDNQRYLRETEKRRMQRALAPESKSSVNVITRRYSTGSFGLYGDRHQPLPQERSFGIEYQNGNTVFRYYDGYQPNCCGPVYIVRPPHNKPPVAVPYRHNKRSGHRR